MSRPHAEIVGAGFVGLTVAAGLAQAGWSVRVHERSPEVRAFGAGIWMWDNGVQVLHAIGAADDAMRGVDAIPRMWNMKRDDSMLHEIPFAPLMSNEGPRMFCITRQRLLMSIKDAAERHGAEFVVSSHVVRARPEGEIETEDGKIYRADLVVGADGVHSKVRDSLGLQKSRKRHIDGATRVLVQHIPDRTDKPEWRYLLEWWSGSRRVLYSPCEGDVFYLCLSALRRDERGSRMPLDTESWGEYFPTIADIIARIDGPSRYDVYETVKLHRWSTGKVAVVGDAAHSMPPGLGQGCGMGIVNGLSLARMVAEGGPVETALARWEVRNREITEHTQYWSTISWPKSLWPLWGVKLFYDFPLWHGWVRDQRSRTARFKAYGTEDLPRWKPAQSPAQFGASPDRPFHAAASASA
jgi:2-polyprenyl-6-methoxyphenol hydroxylase-like FAD-dependent oxidoreductase